MSRLFRHADAPDTWLDARTRTRLELARPAEAAWSARVHGRHLGVGTPRLPLPDGKGSRGGRRVEAAASRPPMSSRYVGQPYFS